MFGLRVFFVCFAILFLAFVWSQMVVPCWKGTRWFPYFRQEKREVQEHIVDARDELDTEESRRLLRGIEDEIRRTRVEDEAAEVPPVTPEPPVEIPAVKPQPKKQGRKK